MWVYYMMWELSANSWVLPISRILGYPSVGQASLIRPLVRIFGLPRPLDPALSLLICDGLSFPELPQERLVTCSKCRCASSQPSATPDPSGAWVAAIVSRTNETTVQILRTIISSGRPFSDDEP